MAEDPKNKANSEEFEASQPKEETPENSVTEPSPSSSEEATPEAASAPNTDSQAEPTAPKEEAPTEEAKPEEAAPTEEAKPAPTEAEEKPATPAAETAAPTQEEEAKIPETAAKPEAAKASEDSEDDEKEQEEEDDDEEFDYSNHTKEQLVDVVEALRHSDDLRKTSKIIKELRSSFDEIVNEEREAAHKQYVEENGEAEADGFEFRPDEHMQRFEAAYNELRDKVKNHFRDQEKTRESNLKRKNDLLEKLRQLVDDDETTASLKEIKGIQEEWKTIGPVPGAHNKTLWANYSALLDRFYDNRSIYFELKELDRKKNLEAKNELVKRAEALEQVENLKDAIRDLNELHEEFKHIGPVPKEEQEPLWQRFKAASDRVYDRRRSYLSNLKGELEENLKAKSALGDEVAEFAKFDSDRINEWNKKTQEILGYQKKWEAIGGLPRDRAKDINKKFWGAFKTFFNHKNQFFKKLEGQRDENLDKKKELVAKAQELKDNTDWDKTAEALKGLQREWREIGPVPEKYRDSVFKEFKEACDHFFNARRMANNEKEQEFHENLKKKEEICANIKALADADSIDIEKLEDLMDDYAEIGFVPRNAIKKIQQKFTASVNHVLDATKDLDEVERERIRMNIQVNKIKGGPNANRKIHRKEDGIRKQIRQLEDDIALWRNNLEFFANSATADKLKEEFDQKIKQAQEDVKKLRTQLKVLRNA